MVLVRFVPHFVIRLIHKRTRITEKAEQLFTALLLVTLHRLFDLSTATLLWVPLPQVFVFQSFYQVGHNEFLFALDGDSRHLS